MEIVLNGEKTTIDEKSSISDLVRKLKLSPGQVAVEVNRQIVSKGQWNAHLLRDGDAIEIVHFVGGGNE